MPGSSLPGIAQLPLWGVVEQVVWQDSQVPVPLPPGTPPVLYVPCAVGVSSEPADVVTRRTLDGRTAVVAYTSLDRLLAACGSGQAWTALSLAQLQELHATLAYDVVYLDLVMPPALRTPGLPEAPGTLPPLLYLPCVQSVGRVEDATLSYLRRPDGSVGLPAYTSLDRLHAALGDVQPWILARADRLSELRSVAPFDELLVDVGVDVATSDTVAPGEGRRS